MREVKFNVIRPVLPNDLRRPLHTQKFAFQLLRWCCALAWVCEHLERTGSVISILLFYCRCAFTTVQPHKSECHSSIKLILTEVANLSQFVNERERDLRLHLHQHRVLLTVLWAVIVRLIYLANNEWKTYPENEPYIEILQWNGICLLYFLGFIERTLAVNLC